MNFKNKLKPFLLICCCAISFIALARFCHRQTEGFRVSKIQPNLIDTSTLSTSNETDKEFLKQLFQQKFTFLGRGLQSFVFASEDGKYVLKIFNNRYQRKIFLFSLLSHFPVLGNWAGHRATYYQDKLLRTFNSYQIAFTEMHDQTGLIYTHLLPSNDLPDQVRIVDKLNICHPLNPNQMGFLIQKRAQLVFPALKEYIQKPDLEGAKQAISSLVGLFFWKWRHGILDNDPLIRTNYGFIDDQAIQIDVGPLSKETMISNKDLHQNEIQRITASLKFWLTENSPELLPFLDRELEQQLSLSQ